MKRLLSITASLALLLCTAACNSDKPEESTPESVAETSKVEQTEPPTEPETETATEPSTEAPTEPETEPPTEEPTTEPETEAETVEEDVLFSISTSETMAEIDAYLIEIAEAHGIEVQYDMATLSFSAPQNVLDEIASEYRMKINEMCSEEYADPESIVRYVVISEDYQTIDFYATRGFADSMEALYLVLYAQPMGELQCLTGRTTDEVSFTENIIDVATGEVIESYLFPDDLA